VGEVEDPTDVVADDEGGSATAVESPTTVTSVTPGQAAGNLSPRRMPHVEHICDRCAQPADARTDPPINPWVPTDTLSAPPLDERR
jgi:hypothetical protein